MKLLFDQNLPPRLVPLLDDLYPGSVHVATVGLSRASDSSIWDYAKQHDFVIVSKDSDFQQRSLLYGYPPKFVWLRVGNCAGSVIVELLRTQCIALQTFFRDTSAAHVMLP